MAVFNTTAFNTALFGGDATAPGLTRQVGPGLLYPALRKAAVTLGPQRTPSVAQFQDAIDELNRLIGSLNCDRLFIYSIANYQFPLDPPKISYTIGIPTDVFTTPDFAAPRPQLIDSANIIYAGLRYPLAILDVQQWSKIRLQNLPNTIPQVLYNDRGYPLSTLSLWGQPMPGQMLELYSWLQVPAFTSITDVVVLPMQYEDAIVLNLALRMAPHFQLPVHPDVRQQARESLMRLESINAPRPIADTSALGCGSDRGYNNYNIYSDQFRR